VLADVSGDPAITHGQRLPGDVMGALETAGVSLDQVELLAVAAGPGSFTGLRVGIATMQGLAFARGLSIVPVSALDAVAEEAAGWAPADALVAAWIDAQRGEVFAALYAPGARAVLHAPTSLPPERTLAGWEASLAGAPVAFGGDGALRYRDVILQGMGHRAVLPAAAPRLAVPVARIAARHPERAVIPHGVVPIYVRRPDAELARDR
jgi:tRNA threonylcarbamoyladenosine biosynthesis protein TsaB